MIKEPSGLTDGFVGQRERGCAMHDGKVICMQSSLLKSSSSYSMREHKCDSFTQVHQSLTAPYYNPATFLGGRTRSILTLSANLRDLHQPIHRLLSGECLAVFLSTIKQTKESNKT